MFNHVLISQIEHKFYVPVVFLWPALLFEIRRILAPKKSHNTKSREFRNFSDMDFSSSWNQTSKKCTHIRVQD